MLVVLFESAIRTLALAAVVWLSFKMLRIRSAHAEQVAWRCVLLAGIAMPLLMIAGRAIDPILVVEPAAELPRTSATTVQPHA